jgi:predicted XRE-type DNA-binding protein
MSHESVFPNNDPAYDAIYAQEAAMIDASELIARALESSGMTQADLARALGVSRSEVTARLGGERNITVRKLAETLHALGAPLMLSTMPADSSRRPSANEWRLTNLPAKPSARAGKWKLTDFSHAA